MEGIPSQDLKDHEKQKTGTKSESDDEEPAAKKNKIEQNPPVNQTAMPPQMMMHNMVHPGMSAQFPLMMPCNFAFINWILIF